jgi:hypothetical protein
MWHVWVEERCIQGFSGEMREEDHLEDPGLDGRIILKWILDETNHIMNEVYKINRKLKWIFERLDGGGGVD